MKNKAVVILITFFSFRGMACDVCGCSLGGFSQGVMPDYSSHFIGLRYSQAHFSSRIDHSSIGQGFEESSDTYQRLDLMARYNLSRRLKLTLNLPYLMNAMEGSHQTVYTSGLGDPVVLMQYQLLKDDLVQKNHFLVVGGGIKLPVGHASLSDNGTLVNRNFQLGTGSVDFLINGSYFYRKNKAGFMAETSYKLNTPNRQDYRFGNQVNLSLNYVYVTGKNHFNALFFAGLFGEQASRHTQNALPVFNTGGQELLTNTGVQVYRKNCRLGTGFQYPLVQNFKTDNLTEIKAKPRFLVDLIFFIGRSKEEMNQ